MRHNILYNKNNNVRDRFSITKNNKLFFYLVREILFCCCILSDDSYRALDVFSILLQPHIIILLSLCVLYAHVYACTYIPHSLSTQTIDSNVPNRFRNIVLVEEKSD